MVLLTIATFPALAQSNLEIPQTALEGAAIQFNYLKITQVSASDDLQEIVATPTRTAEKNCIRFSDIEASRGENIDCPKPMEVGSIAYRILVGPETTLLLRTKKSANLAGFASGDLINVFGRYNADGTIQGLIIRNLSKPIEQNFIQLNNVEVLGLGKSIPSTFLVIQGVGASCTTFEGTRKRDVSCPKGLDSPFAAPWSELVIPEGRGATTRSYEIRVNQGTKILDYNRRKISIEEVVERDMLNVYGSYSDDTAKVIAAEIIRKITGAETSKTLRVEGIVTQVSTGDDTITVRTRSGKLMTLQNPLTVGAFVSVQGTFDEIKKSLKEIKEILFKSLTADDAIPEISLLTPGTGPVGTTVTLIGSGFTKTGNAINIGEVGSVVTNLPSPDGKTIVFIIPTSCYTGATCEGGIPKHGTYELSVTNANGTSNVVRFELRPLPALRIMTAQLPQALEGQKYSLLLNAEGGVQSYSWNVEAGALPPGITITTPTCTTYPCRTTAELAGVPKTSGRYTFTIGVQSGTERTSREFTLVVVQAINTSSY